jgi:hypothetical protein
MKTIVRTFAAVLLSACACFAQVPTPPADGVGLGNSHLSPNSSDSNILTMSPDVNSVMTNSNGSESGNKGVPAFAGAPPADTATRVNAQGTAAANGTVSATSSRRRAYNRNQAVEHTQPNENVNGQQGSPKQ